MPKYTLQPPFARYHGRILGAISDAGQIIFHTPTGASVARKYSRPRGEPSAHQSLIRSYVSATAKAYSALSRSAAEEWNELAAGLEYSNILDDNYNLSGIALFQKINVYRLMAGESISSSIPSTSIVPAALGTITVNEVAGDVSVLIDDTGLPEGTILMFKLSPPMDSAARSATPQSCVACPAEDSFVTAFGLVQSDGSFNEFFFQLGNYVAGKYVGVWLLSLNNDYFPGSLRFEPNIEITV